MSKKVLCIVLCLAMVLGLCAVTAGAATPDGSKDHPYLINSANDLKALAASVNGGNTKEGVYYRLNTDIDFGGAEFTPIGVGHFSSSGHTDPDCAFSGHFDGRGYTISNFKVSQTEAEKTANLGATHTKSTPGNDYDHNLTIDNHSKGLFGYVNGGTVENLVVSKATVTGWNAEAAVIGIMIDGSVSNVHVLDSTIKGAYENAGALIGRQNGSTSIYECSAVGCTVELPTSVNYENGAGGLIGRLQGGSSTVLGCAVSDTSVTAYRKVAGLVGYILQPTLCTLEANSVYNTTLTVNPTEKNSLGTNYYGILFAEIQGVNDNHNRACETYSNAYDIVWSGTTGNPGATDAGTSFNIPVFNLSDDAPSAIPSAVSGTQLKSTDNNIAYNSTQDRFYTTVAEAVLSAGDSDTIILQGDAFVDAQIRVTKNLTLNLNGYVLTQQNGKTAF